MSLLMSLLPASGEFLFGFPSPRHLSSSGSYPLNQSGLGDPTGSNATAGLALRVTGTQKPLYHGKVKIPTKGYVHFYHILHYCITSVAKHATFPITFIHYGLFHDDARIPGYILSNDRRAE
jgi:hypothetical protein